MSKFGEWQPIETAPLDGKELIVCDIKQHVLSRISTVASYWNTHSEPGWRYYEQGDDGCAFITPTHWMPFPEPPMESV